MRNRIILLVIWVAAAAGSLRVADWWQWKMSQELDKLQIDNAAYFVQTWTISFVIAAVAAMWTTIKLVAQWKQRGDSYDNEDGDSGIDGYLFD